MLRHPKKGRPVAVPARTHNPKIDVPLRSHTRGPPKRSPRLRAVCLVQSFKELLRPPRKGKADAKVRLFPVSLQTSGGLFSGEKAAGPKNRGNLAESGCKSTPFAWNAKQNGGFFSREREVFYVGAGRQGVTGSARGGTGISREGDRHLFNIYRAGEGRGKGKGARHAAGTDATCCRYGRDMSRANSERVAGEDGTHGGRNAKKHARDARQTGKCLTLPTMNPGQHLGQHRLPRIRGAENGKKG